MYKKVLIAAILAGSIVTPALAHMTDYQTVSDKSVIMTNDNIDHRGRGRCRDCGPRPPHHGWRDRGHRRHRGSGRFTIYFSL